MTSGNREVVVNPLERAVSTDIMRGQNFSGAHLSEILRALFNTGIGGDEVQGGGAYLPNITTGNPSFGNILSGLLFTPAVGSVAASVGPGILGVYDPDTSPSTDDSQYKIVEDPGTSSLPLTANSSGQTRIDVVECARVQPDNVVETDSRDIFNTVTGLFAAATVNKVTQAQLQYRIRLGTPGSGFPGTVSGWLPIAVASVPTATSVWDTVTVWDVRPLLSDRVLGPMPIFQEYPRRTKLDWSTSNAGGTNNVASGIVEANFGTDSGAIRLGGILKSGNLGQDGNGVDFSESANQQAALSLSGTGLVYYYLLTPFGLPRWVVYSLSGTGNRIPYGPRGIPLVSNVAPIHVLGRASSPIEFPAVFGFNGATASTFEALCFGASTFSAGVIAPQSTADGWTDVATPLAAVYGSGGTGSTSGTFTLTGGTQFPPSATRLRCLLGAFITLASHSPQVATMTPTLTTGLSGLSAQQFSSNQCDDREIYTNTGLTGLVGYAWEVEINLVNGYPGSIASVYTVNYNLNVTLPAGATIGSAPNLQVLGWKFD